MLYKQLPPYLLYFKEMRREKRFCFRYAFVKTISCMCIMLLFPSARYFIVYALFVPSRAITKKIWKKGVQDILLVNFYCFVDGLSNVYGIKIVFLITFFWIEMNKLKFLFEKFIIVVGIQ